MVADSISNASSLSLPRFATTRHQHNKWYPEISYFRVISKV
ncbi:hypothetical protein T01_15080 [Trichinella spiralis]|uniref:Uncharacterized protein n=1 Tax=Trichinella spiralis TaxID=6334 RepID=A0A0V1A863_TRISP|nr:hypothetical protein T01_15080 [Trichinella spiralis]